MEKNIFQMIHSGDTALIESLKYIDTSVTFDPEYRILKEETIRMAREAMRKSTSPEEYKVVYLLYGFGNGRKPCADEVAAHRECGGKTA